MNLPCAVGQGHGLLRRRVLFYGVEKRVAATSLCFGILNFFVVVRPHVSTEAILDCLWFE
jgi:hypothetical protein